jgi:hypothetical protein
MEKEMTRQHEFSFAIHCTNQKEWDAAKAYGKQVGYTWASRIDLSNKFPSNDGDGVLLLFGSYTKSIRFSVYPRHSLYDGLARISIKEILRRLHKPMLIAGHDVTDLGRAGAKVGCTNVTYEEVCRLKKAMEDA